MHSIFLQLSAHKLNMLITRKAAVDIERARIPKHRSVIKCCNCNYILQLFMKYITIPNEKTLNQLLPVHANLEYIPSSCFRFVLPFRATKINGISADAKENGNHVNY